MNNKQHSQDMENCSKTSPIEKIVKPNFIDSQR